MGSDWSALLGRVGRAIARPLGSFWPGACLLCEQPVAAVGVGTSALCGSCQRALPGLGRARCPVCAAPRSPAAAGCPDCARLAPAFSATLAAADYRSPLAEAIVALKFGARTELASGCGRLIAEALDPAMAVDALVAIPLAPARLVERGFNQAALIAAALARHWPPDAPHRPRLQSRWLSRQRETRRQTGLGGDQRRHNLDRGFVASPAVAGKAVALVDDVMTTGATLDAAARALRAAGARDVVALVVARTP
jgi:ComF family protein